MAGPVPVPACLPACVFIDASRCVLGQAEYAFEQADTSWDKLLHASLRNSHSHSRSQS